MAFVETWDESKPDGAIQKGFELDDEVRVVKRALRERNEGDVALAGWCTDFQNTSKPKEGMARVFFDIEANLGTKPLEDGRIFVSTDTNRLWHLATGGAVELAYAKVGAAQTVTALWTFNPGTTPQAAVRLDIDALVAAGQRDSHNILIVGRSFDGGAHNIDWAWFVDVTSNAGASALTFQSRIDGAGFVTRFSITDAGVLTADSARLGVTDAFVTISRGGANFVNFVADSGDGLIFMAGSGNFIDIGVNGVAHLRVQAGTGLATFTGSDLSVDTLTATAATFSAQLNADGGIGTFRYVQEDVAIAASTDDLSIDTRTGIIRRTGAGSQQLTGIAGGVGGRILIFTNSSGSGAAITMFHEDVSSLAANRFITHDGTSQVIDGDESVMLWYDGTESRWRVLSFLGVA